MHSRTPVRKLFSIPANIALIVIFFSITASDAYSQNAERSDRDRQRSGSINIDALISGDPFYFIDELTLELGISQFAQEGYINADEYLMGPGDIISIEFMGGLNGTMRGIRVNPQGDINLPNVGSISIKDLSMTRARQKISGRVEERYRDTEITLSLDKARPITIHITGDVPFPGKREIHALTRVDQAIYSAFFENAPHTMQSGGAPHRYSNDFLSRREYTLRNITIRGQNGENQNADLMAYFKGGTIEANPVVKNGDVITIRRMRRYSPTVTISGAVKSAEELEYRPEDTLGDMLKISNGYTHDADKSRINIFRAENDQINKIVVETEQEDINTIGLKPNDRIVVPFDRTLQNNKAAWVYGEAASPGSYPIIDGKTTVYDLLQMANGTTGQALNHAAYLVRGKASSSDISEGSTFDASLLKRTSDQLRQGFEYLDLEVGLNRNQIFLNSSDSEQLSNIKVYDGDQLHIPKDDQTIYMMGQIKSPGFYPFDQNLSVDDYISRAGSFALAAEVNRVFVIKSGSRSWYRPAETSLESGDIIFIDRVPYDELQGSRAYDMQVRGQRNSNIQLIMTGLATVTGIITTYVAITR